MSISELIMSKIKLNRRYMKKVNLLKMYAKCFTMVPVIHVKLLSEEEVYKYMKWVVLYLICKY